MPGSVGAAWLFSAVGTVALAPVGLAWWGLGDASLEPIQLAFLAGSALLHAGYMVALQKGYGLGDLSLVYPLARGTGPALATAAAILLLGERPEPPTLAGTALVALSAFGLAGGSLRGSPRAVGMGLLTGGFIAAYTVWDATAVSRAGLAPLLFMALTEPLRALVLAPFAWRRRAEVRTAWREARGAVLAVGLASPLAYLLALQAFRMAPVSVVAPAREVSILVGALLGTRFLGEGDGWRRLPAAAGMALGVALLARG